MEDFRWIYEMGKREPSAVFVHNRGVVYLDGDKTKNTKAAITKLKKELLKLKAEDNMIVSGPITVDPQVVLDKLDKRSDAERKAEVLEAYDGL